MMGHFLEISIKDWVLLVFGAILSLIVTGLIYGYGWLRHRHVQNALQTTDGLRDELKTLQKVYARLQQTYETLNAQRAALLPQLILAHDKAQPDEAWRYQDGLANWLTVWRERLGEHAAHLALALLVNPDGEENQGLAMALLAAALGNRSAADLLIENEVKALAKADDLGAGSSNPAWEHLFQAIRPTQRQDQIALCNNAGRKGQEAYKAGDYRLATRWFRLALYLGEVAYGPDHPHVARYLNNLGQLLQATNRLVEAEPLMRRALAIEEASNGPDHPHVARYLNNLGQLLQATNRLVEAEPLMRRALAIEEASNGPNHPHVAIHLMYLVELLKVTNRLVEAEPLMRRALAIDEASYDPNHPEVATCLICLAALLYATNRLVEAEPMIRRALAIDEASYDPDHPRVARDLNNLGQLLKVTNRLADAEPLMRRALAIDEASYGPNDPHVATCLTNLAQLLQGTNRLVEAERLMRRALAIDEASYGPDHPGVAIHLNNLGQLLYATNRLVEAEPLMRRQLEILLAFKMTTGHEHQYLGAAIGNYTGLLEAMGRSSEQIREQLNQVGVAKKDS